MRRPSPKRPYGPLFHRLVRVRDDRNRLIVSAIFMHGLKPLRDSSFSNRVPKAVSDAIDEIASRAAGRRVQAGRPMADVALGALATVLGGAAVYALAGGHSRGLIVGAVVGLGLWMLIGRVWFGFVWRRWSSGGRSNAREIALALLRRGCCGACGYALEGLARRADGCVVCPECGAAWNPEKRGFSGSP